MTDFLLLTLVFAGLALLVGSKPPRTETKTRAVADDTARTRELIDKLDEAAREADVHIDAFLDDIRNHRHD